MRKIVTRAISFLASDHEGATLIEYALLVALIAVVIASSVGAMGVAVQELYNTIQAPFV